jgi:hypothetical protein
MTKVGSGSGSRQDALYMAQSYDSDDTYRSVIGSIGPRREWLLT